MAMWLCSVGSPVVADGGERLSTLLYDLPGQPAVLVGLVDGVTEDRDQEQDTEYMHQGVVVDTLLHTKRVCLSSNFQLFLTPTTALSGVRVTPSCSPRYCTMLQLSLHSSWPRLLDSSCAAGG